MSSVRLYPADHSDTTPDRFVAHWCHPIECELLSRGPPPPPSKAPSLFFQVHVLPPRPHRTHTLTHAQTHILTHIPGRLRTRAWTPAFLKSMLRLHGTRPWPCGARARPQNAPAWRTTARALRTQARPLRGLLASTCCRSAPWTCSTATRARAMAGSAWAVACQPAPGYTTCARGSPQVWTCVCLHVRLWVSVGFYSLVCTCTGVRALVSLHWCMRVSVNV